MNHPTLNKLKQNDYDRYISTLFVEKEKLNDVLELLEFYIEIATIKNKVSDPTLGFIRIQWWRERIEEIFSGSYTTKNNTIVDSIAKLVEKYNLKREDFLNILSARESDFVETPFETEGDLQKYLINTTFGLNSIISNILVTKEISSSTLEMIKSHSEAWAVSAILFSANKNFSKGRNIFPQNLCQKYNLDYTDYGSSQFVENSKKIVVHLVKDAQSILSTSNKLEIDKQDQKFLKPITMYKTLAEYRLKQIKNNEFNIFTKKYNPYISTFYMIKLLFFSK